MKSYFVFGILAAVLAAFAACSNNPVTPDGKNGNLTISIVGSNSPGLQLSKSSLCNCPTLTSVRAVIEKVELENSLDASVDFKFNQPFIQDLVTITSLAEIQTLQVPFGTYDRIRVSIDDLDSQDGDVFTNNPELQNLSILLQGYVDNDTTQTFTFSSDRGFTIDLTFDPPIVINDSTASKNIVLGVDFNSWLVDKYGRFLDPAEPGNQERIEANIEKSLQVFEDNDRDGCRDNYYKNETAGTIDSLGTDHLLVSGKTFYVNDATIIKNGDNRIQFQDLAVGMEVEIYALPQDDGTWLAIKIKTGDSDYHHQ